MAPKQAAKTKAKLRMKQERQVIDMFQKLDRNGDGTIEAKDLCSVLQDLDKTKWTEKNIQALFRVIDTNRDGTIDYNKFVTWAFSSKRVCAVEAHFLEACDDLNDSEDKLPKMVALHQQRRDVAAVLDRQVVEAEEALAVDASADLVARKVAELDQETKRLEYEATSVEDSVLPFLMQYNISIHWKQFLGRDARELAASLKPSAKVLLLGDAFCKMFGERPGWMQARTLFLDPRCHEWMENYDYDHTPAEVIEKISAEFCSNPECCQEAMMKSSASTANVAKWIREMCTRRSVYLLVRERQVIARHARLRFEVWQARATAFQT